VNRAYDEFGEDERGRELVTARAACEGRFTLLEVYGGFVAVPVATEVVSALTVFSLMGQLGIDYSVEDAPAAAPELRLVPGGRSGSGRRTARHLVALPEGAR